MRAPIVSGEWYHCYSRGIDKRTVFAVDSDYRRFMQLLYLANQKLPIRHADLPSRITSKDFYVLARGAPLVSIGAFCLMSNHFHLLIQEINEGGISAFMQKLGTAYTMYFNIKYKRSGGLFTRPFRSRHVSHDRYFQHVIDYIHLNPSDEGHVQSERKLRQYPYSSFGIFSRSHSLEQSILGKEVFDVYRSRSFSEMFKSKKMYQL